MRKPAVSCSTLSAYRVSSPYGGIISPRKTTSARALRCMHDVGHVAVGIGLVQHLGVGLDAGFGEQLGEAGVLAVAFGLAAGDGANRQAGAGPLGD